MNLTEIISKIKNDYKEYLIEEDQFILDNNPIEYNIRVIVNKIWDKYLTNPFEHDDKNFRYLVKKNDIVFPEIIDFSELPVFQDEVHFLEILSSENILTEKDGRVGFVVKTNWFNSNKILLPDDLQNGVYVRTTLTPRALFSINIGEGKVNASYELASIISEENDILFLDLNLRKYISNYKLGLGDKQQIINGFVSYYLIGKKDFTNIDEHERLRAKYGTYIIKKYNKLTAENAFNDEIFIKEMSEFIDVFENNPKLKL